MNFFTKHRISCEKKNLQMHVKMVQAFVNIRLAVLPMNQNDGGGRIKHIAIKKEAKIQQKASHTKTDKKWHTSCDQVKRFAMVHGRETSPKMHMCSQITTINQKR